MKKEIKELILMGENHLIEFKERFDKSLNEEICAFANSSGGKIILGVTDSGDIKGIDTSNEIRSKIQNTIRQLKPSLNVTLFVEDNVIILDVPNGEEKPYACSRGFFRRIGSNTQKLDRDEIIEFSQSEGAIRFERLTHETATFEKDFNERAFEKFLELSKTTPVKDPKTILKNLKCLTHDDRMTNLGVLFFAKDIKFLLNECVIRCLLFQGTKRVKILDDKSYSKGLIENIDDTLGFIQRHSNLEIRIGEKTPQSEPIPDYPEDMLREGIVNAVCHRDYFNKGADIVISVLKDRVLISSPGGLLSSIKADEFGEKSISRNPLITTMLRYVNYAEKAGKGIKRMSEIAENHKKKVRMELEYDSFFELTFYKDTEEERVQAKKIQRSVKKEKGTLSDLEKTSNFNILYKDEFQSEIGINLKEFRFIFGVSLKDFSSLFGVNVLKTACYIYKNPNATAKELAEKLSVAKRTTEKYLSKLKEAGYIKRVGSRKDGHWEIVKK